MVQRSAGSTLESIIGTHPSVVELWKSYDRVSELLPLQFHERFWGKSRADEEQRWHNAQPPMPVEGSGSGNEREGGREPMDVDVNEEEDEEEDEDDVIEEEEEDEDEDEGDVIDGCCFLDLGDFDLDIPRIWIRAEYIRMYDAVEKCCKKAVKKAPAAVITGQPGIGKSMWIYYALCRRLSERKPVIRYFKNTCYLFVEEGVYRVPKRFQEFQTFVWTLVDSDCSKEGVPERLVNRFTRHFVIYSTSPNQDRWRHLHKTVDRKTLIMNPWKIKEIHRVIDMLPPTKKVNRDRATRIFKKFGPIPRLCIDHLGDPKLIKEYKDDVKIIISALTTNKLEELFTKSKTLSMDAQSHKICLVRRRDEGDMRSLPMVSLITSSIESKLLNHFQTAEHCKQISLYKSLSKVPELRKLAGVFFKAAAQRCLQGGTDLKFFPMVRPASSKTGKPRWYSTHVVFLNNAKLERSRQLALQNGQLVVIPEGLDIVEYMKDGPPSPIMSNVFYVPKSTNQVAHDSFIVMNNFLYIFQFTIDEEHQIETGVIDFVGRYPELPPMVDWRFIFILPLNHKLVCPQPQKRKRKQPQNSEMEDLQPDIQDLKLYSAVINFGKLTLG